MTTGQTGNMRGKGIVEVRYHHQQQWRSPVTQLCDAQPAIATYNDLQVHRDTASNAFLRLRIFDSIRARTAGRHTASLTLLKALSGSSLDVIPMVRCVG